MAATTLQSQMTQSQMSQSQMSQSQVPRGEEPPMYLQRPSSARSQDVSHVLARTFRQLFTRDAVAPDTVEYLNTSKGGDDAYHEKYVEALHQVCRFPLYPQLALHNLKNI